MCNRPLIHPAVLLLAAALARGQTDDQVRQAQHAQQLMAAGRYADAVPIYRKLVEAIPDNPGLLLNLALAEHMSGDQRPAIAHFEAVLKVQPRSLPALLSLAAAHLELNEPRAAIAPLQKVVAMEPANRDARGMLAGALFSAERFEPAAEQYRALVKLSPDDPQAWFGLGKSYESLATRTFDELTRSDPKSGYMAALLADTRLQRRQYRAAFSLYQQALEQLPALPGMHAGIAEVYRRTGHADWAVTEDDREKSVRKPDCAARTPACDFLGGQYLEATTAGAAANRPEALFWRSKAFDELARAAYAQLGRLPESPQIHEVKAGILRAQGQLLESANEWREAARLAPGNARFEREWTSALYLAGDYQNALPHLEPLLRADPDSAELNLMMGDSLLHLDDVEKSLPFLEKAVRRDPSLLPAHASLGLAYSRSGKSAQAARHLEAALPLDEDGSLHYQLARAWQAAGLTEKARAMMEQYQDIQRKLQSQKNDPGPEILPPK
jgi:tetratricopeptide (TPR) repeat protein